MHLNPAMPPRAVTPLVERLSAASAAARPGFDPIDWPSSVAPDGAWFFSPELLSPAGLPEFEALPEAARMRLSFWEAVNFFSLNIHGERQLVAGIAQRLYAPASAALAPYLHHFLEEENRHMAWFGGFCHRYAGKVYPEKRLALGRAREDGAEDFVFFAQALLFEELVDAFNRAVAADARVCLVARTINRLHHEDEQRHIVFGRRLVLTLFEEGMRRWSAPQCVALQDELIAFVALTWRQFCNPDAYADTGLSDPYGLVHRAWSHPAAVARRAAIEADALGWLRQAGVLPERAAP